MLGADVLAGSTWGGEGDEELCPSCHSAVTLLGHSPSQQRWSTAYTRTIPAQQWTSREAAALSGLTCSHYVSSPAIVVPTPSLSMWKLATPIVLLIKTIFWGGHAGQHEILLPQTGMNLCPLQWKHEVLATGPPGNSSSFCHLSLALLYFCILQNF